MIVELEKFFRSSISDTERSVVTFSAGVAIASHKFPIYFVLDAAEKMLSKAKGSFRTVPNSDGLFNFPRGSFGVNIITEAMPIDKGTVFVMPDDDDAIEMLVNDMDMIKKDIIGSKQLFQHLLTVPAGPSGVEDRLNTIKYLHSSFDKKEVFKSYINAYGMHPAKIIEYFSKIMQKEDLFMLYKGLVPIMWEGGT